MPYGQQFDETTSPGSATRVTTWTLDVGAWKRNPDLDRGIFAPWKMWLTCNQEEDGDAETHSSALVAVRGRSFRVDGALRLHRPIATTCPTMSGGAASQKLAAELALGRLATAKYATNLGWAKKDGYGIITQMIPNMG